MIPQGLGTALKPASEIVVVARKPLVGTVAANVCEHGTGALHIDACRVGTDEALGRLNRSTSTFNSRNTTPWVDNSAGKGRWPANVVLDEPSAEALDAQSGTLTSGALDRSKITAPNGPEVWGRGMHLNRTGTYEADSGGASRFFYVAKAPKRERPRTDTTVHPTVKPLTLMRWLVRLVTPPGGTVLDPFAGSGTTAEACLLEGFDCIAIEREADYLPLIEQRLARHELTLFGEMSA